MVFKTVEAQAEFQNLIGGRELLISTKTFPVFSPFYPDFLTKVPDSNLFDVTAAISKAKGAVSECARLSFEKREEILQNASRSLKFSSFDREYVVKMTGMPITSVNRHLQEAALVLKEVPQVVRERIGVAHGRIARHPVKGRDLFKFLEPVQGFVYVVTPGNDVRVVAHVAAWLATVGMAGIFKVSKNDLLISQKVLRALIDAGYPANGLQLLCWDTSKPDSHVLNFSLVDASKVVWAFGNTDTVDNLLRYEERHIGGQTIKVDHFSDKIVLRHISGRSAAIVDTGVNLSNAADMAVESAFSWPIGCNSLKAVFDASDQHEEFMAKLKERAEKLSAHAGDPLKEDTRVGYVDFKTLAFVSKRMRELMKLGLLSVQAGKELNHMQSTPFLFSTNDVHSEFLANEFSIYLLTVKKSPSFNKAVEELNETTGPNKRLSVSIFSEDETKVLRTRLHAHHVKRMRHTTELDILFHEGQDYLHKLTEPQIHRVAPT